jgi:DNA recombination protein RmuC
MSNILLIATVILLLANVALLLVLIRKTSQASTAVLASRLDAFEKEQERIERAVREEVARNREELSKAAREQRQELTEAFKTFGDSVVQR